MGRPPTTQDFLPILPSHPAYRPPPNSPPPTTCEPWITLIPPPSPPIRAILILLHGLGDTERPFAHVARNLSLPGVFCISLRGVSRLPSFLLPPGPADPSGQGGPEGFHWGDDLKFSAKGLDDDPGFAKAREWIVEKVIGQVLVGECKFEWGEVMMFGFGQGGSVALGVARGLEVSARVVDVTEGEKKDVNKRRTLKGVVSIGGALPPSMVPSVSARLKAKVPVLVCCGRQSQAVDEDAVDTLEEEFEKVKVVRWNKPDDGMPQNRDEMLPVMEWFADRLRGPSPWV